MSDTYSPRSGTLAARAFEILKRRGTWVPTEELCTQCEKDSSAVITAMRMALDTGSVQRRKSPAGDARKSEWRIRPAEADDDAPLQLVVPAASCRPVPTAGVRSAFEMAPTLKTPRTPVEAREAATAPVAAPDGASAEGARATPKDGADSDGQGARFALWSNGTLEVRRNEGDLVLFTKVETRELLRYLTNLNMAWEQPA
jgi:hypothetical protein